MNAYSDWSARVATQYGRKQGWLKSRLHSLFYGAGAFRNYQRIEWDRVKRVVFVCSGNICRSPYCEARARAAGLNASSFGLAADPGKSANEVATEIARKRRLDVSAHRTRTATEYKPAGEDLLVAMEPEQARRLERLTAGSGAQVTLLGLWIANPRPFLQDPYGLSREYFETCFTILDEGVQRIAMNIQSADGK